MEGEFVDNVGDVERTVVFTFAERMTFESVGAKASFLKCWIVAAEAAESGLREIPGELFSKKSLLMLFIVVATDMAEVGRVLLLLLLLNVVIVDVVAFEMAESGRLRAPLLFIKASKFLIT